MRYRWALIAIAAIAAGQVILLAVWPSPFQIACLAITVLAFAVVLAVSWRTR
jgi:hypothetical protein